MWTTIKDFFTNWLGTSIEVPIPFTQNETIDLVDLVGLFVLFFVLIWVFSFIRRIIDSIFSMF